MPLEILANGADNPPSEQKTLEPVFFDLVSLVNFQHGQNPLSSLWTKVPSIHFHFLFNSCSAYCEWDLCSWVIFTFKLVQSNDKEFCGFKRGQLYPLTRYPKLKWDNFKSNWLGQLLVSEKLRVSPAFLWENYFDKVNSR